MIQFDVFKMEFGKIIQFDYVNWKGENSERTAEPVKIFYGSNEFHTEEQWLLVAVDINKLEVRTFAMKDMSNVRCKY